MNQPTPLIKQYLEVKRQVPDAILFYRMGDFYEMFFEDATLAAKILDIALTSRDKNKEDSVPLCGVPYHAASGYIQKLVNQGYKVAICEQMEEAAKGKGIVRREITRVVTPGTVLEDDILQPKVNNFLMALSPGEACFGMAFLDASTGDFLSTEVNTIQSVWDEIMRLEPKEILFPESAKNLALCRHLMKNYPGALYSPLPADVFDLQRSSERIEALGLTVPEGNASATEAVGAILFYIQETQKVQPGHISRLESYQVRDYMVLDETTRKNLELFENLQTRGRKGSLIDLLDETVTSMGGRMLKRWISAPLLDLSRIHERLDAVEEMKEQDLKRRNLREILGRLQDMERLSGRISLKTAHARDLVALRSSLHFLPSVKTLLSSFQSALCQGNLLALNELPELLDLLDRGIEDNPPGTLKEGGLIKKGFHGELDRLRGMSQEGKKWIAELETRERVRTGISSLKIRYNRVFGYYIEITKANLPAVPSHYMRKQTLANAERFITQELQEYESQVLQAEEQKDELEYQIFLQILERVGAEISALQKIGRALAEVDVLAALGEVAERYHYCRPNLEESDRLVIVEGRHPVLERMTLNERFVPNDLTMDTEERQILVITGPNMAGKSTIMRQAALIVVLSQLGSFVPAQEAKIGMVDRIFTRVGATDDLVRGRSTFMVEMEEVAHILRNVTPRSFILLDEIGRGTSTFDGLSIAWAVTEYLHDECPGRPRTLFATHYHELTELALTKPRVRNFHVAVKEWNDQVIFLRKLVEGGTSRSYGIQVARLAGLPAGVVERAKEVLNNLEQGEVTEGGLPKLALSRKKRPTWETHQGSLFTPAPDPLRETLRDLDPNRLTPLEALTLITEIKSRFSSEKP